MRISPLLTGFLFVLMTPVFAEKEKDHLHQYQWKKRIILTYPSSSKVWAEQLNMQRKLHAEVRDRDLIILRLDAAMQDFSKSQREALIKKYKLTKGSHILIGKDGGVKDRQTGALNLKTWFKLIDTMPMRKSEMKR